jgi:ribonuclease BN (tRNA processing enzyme)
VWGVRGAISMPEADYLEYGGHTSCISADFGGRLVILDAGSGLTGLGLRMRREGRKRADILLSHLHIDHVSGLFGFPLLFDPEAQIHLYGRQGAGKHLSALAGTPYWPLGFSDVPAQVEIHEIKAGEHFFLAGEEKEPDGIKVRTLPGKHPGESILYRLEAEGRSIIHALDCEMDEEMFRRLQRFAEDGDLLIWDANFTEEDLAQRRGWGHSSWREGLRLRQEAGVREVLMTHYSWEYADRFLQEQEKMAVHADTACRFAKEGMVIWV